MIEVLGPGDLARADRQVLDRLLRRRGFALAVGTGVLSGFASAVLLHSDYAAITSDSEIHLDSAEAWTGAIWRLGSRAPRLPYQHRPLSAAAAHGAGLCDAVVPAGMNPLQWVSDWVADRSEQALESAAILLRSAGGDRLERAEFAWLFATGEPQRGLQRFLERPKRPKG